MGFLKKIQEACEGGRAPELWVQLVVQYYHMVYVDKNFIKGTHIVNFLASYLLD